MLHNYVYDHKFYFYQMCSRNYFDIIQAQFVGQHENSDDFGAIYCLTRVKTYNLRVLRTV